MTIFIVIIMAWRYFSNDAENHQKLKWILKRHGLEYFTWLHLAKTFNSDYKKRTGHEPEENNYCNWQFSIYIIMRM